MRVPIIFAIAVIAFSFGQQPNAAAQEGISLPAEMTSEEASAFLDLHYEVAKLSDQPPQLRCSDPSTRRQSALLDQWSDHELFEMLERSAGKVGARIADAEARVLRKKLQIEFCGLRNAELAAILLYAGSRFGPINLALRTQDWESLDLYKGIIILLESALEKLAPYQGLVRRGAEFSSSAREAFNQSEVVVFRGFTSTSTDNPFEGPDKMLLRSKTCRWIGPLTQLNNENEVLCPIYTTWKVRFKDKTKNGDYRYLLEETDESNGIVIDD